MELRHLRYFLRVALSDGITPSRLPALLAQCREEDPEVEVRSFEVPLTQQIKGLHDDLYDAGFSMAEDAGDGIVVTPAWEDELEFPLSHGRLSAEEFSAVTVVFSTGDCPDCALICSNSLGAR